MLDKYCYKKQTLKINPRLQRDTYDLNSAYIPSIRKQHTRLSWVSAQVIKEKKRKKKKEEKDPTKL